MLIKLFLLLKRLYGRLRTRYRFMVKELELSGWPRSWQALRLVAAGFHSDKAVLYQLGGNRLPLPTYLSDLDRLRTSVINKSYKPALDDKILFSGIFGELVRCPQNFGFISGSNQYVPLVDAHKAARNMTFLGVLPLLPATFVLKRVGGGGGKHIYLVRREAGQLVVNGKSMTEARLGEIIKGRRFLITETIEQGAWSRALYPGSVNTLRVVTINERRGAWVAFAAQRIGRKESAPTDNLNRGGLCALLDKETATLGPALSLSHTYRPKALTHHPDTGAPIAGQVVPGWSEIEARLVRLAQHFPGMLYVGWDVVLLDEGFMLLEGNSYPGVQLFQLHQPLFALDGAAEFFYRQGVLSRHKLTAALDWRARQQRQQATHMTGAGL